MKRSLLFVCVTLSLLVYGTSNASTQRAPCATPAHHQFDFWLGSWRVADRSGTFQGTNVVTSEFAGCVIQEHWNGSHGSRGSSFNTYIPTTHRWQQTWVDSSGLTLLLTGGIAGKSMVLAGNRIAQDGKTLTDRITWTPLSDGRVRQHWQERAGETMPWQDVFDGYYSHQ